jgi:hypothetical protein
MQTVTLFHRHQIQQASLASACTQGGKIWADSLLGRPAACEYILPAAAISLSIARLPVGFRKATCHRPQFHRRLRCARSGK